MSDKASDPIEFNYTFTLADGRAKKTSIRLDRNSLSLIPRPRKEYPDWTKLSHNQCENCPLKEAESPRCPIAANIADLIDDFRDSVSYEKAEVEVATPDRKYVKQTTVADGVSSMIGIYMVTSGCPIMGKLKPMVRTHLPFSTWEETVFRFVSTYLLAQHFLYLNGKKPDWTLEGIVDLTRDLSLVNQSFCRRLSDAQILDATLNGIVQLDAFALLTNYFMSEKRIDELKPLFDAYLEKSAGS